jgi:hypothetical protein
MCSVTTVGGVQADMPRILELRGPRRQAVHHQPVAKSGTAALQAAELFIYCRSLPGAPRTRTATVALRVTVAHSTPTVSLVIWNIM